MDFEKQKPVSNEYRDGWTFAFRNRVGSGPEQDIRVFNVQVPSEYSNGCPILPSGPGRDDL